MKKSTVATLGIKKVTDCTVLKHVLNCAVHSVYNILYAKKQHRILKATGEDKKGTKPLLESNNTFEMTVL